MPAELVEKSATVEPSARVKLLSQMNSEKVAEELRELLHRRVG